MDALAANPAVAVEMDCGHQVIYGDYTCSYSFAYRSIMGNGRAELLTDREKKRYGLQKIMEHMAPEAELVFLDSMLERVCVYCIEMEGFTGKKRSLKKCKG